MTRMLYVVYGGAIFTQGNKAKYPSKCHYVNIYVVSGNEENIFVKAT
jgi:hypothetical protein